MTTVQRLQAEGELPTGLIYVNPEARNLHHQMKLPAGALNRLDETDLCPGAHALSRVNAGLR
jgi:2-oxoglutarate ferredoxin oxidoreductase subunit beta